MNNSEFNKEKSIKEMREKDINEMNEEIDQLFYKKAEAFIGLEDECLREGAFEEAWLPKEDITFNPSDKESIDNLLSKYGPEGLWCIAKELEKAAMEDVDGALADADRENFKYSVDKIVGDEE